MLLKGRITDDKSRGLLFEERIVLKDKFYLYFGGEECWGDDMLCERNYFEANSFLIEFFGL